jgi:glutamate synthase (NADPH) large chain
VVAKGRLKPGQMLAVDTTTGKLLLPDEIDRINRERQPYRQWLRTHADHLKARLTDRTLMRAPMGSIRLDVYEKLFGVTFEERDQVLRVLAEAGQEAVGSMGDDTPMPVLSRLHERSLFDYFRQQFAQVTNPPIDPLREQIVMSLETCLGASAICSRKPPNTPSGCWWTPRCCRRRSSASCSLDGDEYRSIVIDLNYDPAVGLESAIRAVTTRPWRRCATARSSSS